MQTFHPAWVLHTSFSSGLTGSRWERGPLASSLARSTLKAQTSLKCTKALPVVLRKEIALNNVESSKSSGCALCEVVGALCVNDHSCPEFSQS